MTCHDSTTIYPFASVGLLNKNKQQKLQQLPPILVYYLALVDVNYFASTYVGLVAKYKPTQPGETEATSNQTSKPSIYRETTMIFQMPWVTPTANKWTNRKKPSQSNKERHMQRQRGLLKHGNRLALSEISTETYQSPA